MATVPSVSVVVPTHERCDRLPAFLDALAGEPTGEIIVVANASTDGSVTLLEARAREDERLVPLSISAASKTTALQVGVERARGEVVLMLDDDVLAEPGLVAGHARHHAERRKLLVVGYMPIWPPQRRRPGEFPSDLYQRSYERVCREYESDPGSILHGLWAGNISLRREDLLGVGLEVEGVTTGEHWYHEDREFGLRCAASGIEASFDRNLRARHDHRGTGASFLRVARDSGYMRWTIHRAHADSLGPLPADFYQRGAPMPGRVLVRLARRKGAHGFIQAFLRGVTKASGRLHFFRLETHAGFLMGTIEQQRGAQDAAASRQGKARG
jgi:glycosyltransferase involved in cell wall biosynthesis